MNALFGWLSKHWLRIAEKINGVIFSFVFFWGTLGYLYHFENKIYNHFDHLHQTTGNGGYFDLQIVVFLVSCVVDFVWFITPFFITGAIVYWNKVNK
jgi:hypothetical protein